MRKAAALLGLIVVSSLNAQTAKEQAVPMNEWNVPWPDTRPRDPYVDGKGRVWFVGQEGNYIAYLEPQSGKFKRYEIEEGTNPHNLIVDKQDMVWYTGNRNGRIGRLDPETGAIKTFMMPDAAARDPHTLIADNSGVLWFTVQAGNFVGRITPSSGKVELIKVGTSGARPYGIAIDSKGRPWLDLFGTNRIAMIDPSTFTLKEVVLPNADARPRRIAITSDDRIWYGDYMTNVLGVYDPATKKVTEFPLPSGNSSRPYAMAVDDADRIWVVETGVEPNMMVEFDAKTHKFISSTPIPSGGGVVRHMYFHKPTREIWFGSDNGTIGRAKVPPAKPLM